MRRGQEMKRLLLVSAAATLSCLMAQAQSCDATKVLAQMDTASAKFQSTQADFKWDVLQSVVNEHDIQSGTIYFERHGDSTSMAAYIKQPAPSPSSSTARRSRCSSRRLNRRRSSAPAPTAPSMRVF